MENSDRGELIEIADILVQNVKTLNSCHIMSRLDDYSLIDKEMNKELQPEEKI